MWQRERTQWERSVQSSEEVPCFLLAVYAKVKVKGGAENALPFLEQTLKMLSPLEKKTFLMRFH